MKLAILAVAGLAASASAQSLDISGIATDGAADVNAGNIVSAGAVTEIAFDLNFTAISPSWGSELFITITGPGGFVATAGGSDAPADLTFGWADSSGTYTFNGSLAVAGGAGTYTVFVGESFNDAGQDGFINQGTVTLIPTPGAAALLGLGGVAATRRRR
ncbi:MAG: hypothetical protein RLN60_05405 [Phycisphaerales bacterium]